MTISGQLVNLKFILGQKNQQSQKKSNENLHMALEPVLLLADKNLEPMSKVYQNSSFDPFLGIFVFNLYILTGPYVNGGQTTRILVAHISWKMLSHENQNFP